MAQRGAPGPRRVQGVSRAKVARRAPARTAAVQWAAEARRGARDRKRAPGAMDIRAARLPDATRVQCRVMELRRARSLRLPTAAEEATPVTAEVGTAAAIAAEGSEAILAGASAAVAVSTAAEASAVEAEAFTAAVADFTVVAAVTASSFSPRFR